MCVRVFPILSQEVVAPCSLTTGLLDFIVLVLFLDSVERESPGKWWQAVYNMLSIMTWIIYSCRLLRAKIHFLFIASLVSSLHIRKECLKRNIRMDSNCS